MALSGEIASLFVRIRPNLGGFAAEMSAGVRGAMTKVQTEVTAAARSSVSASTTQIEAARAVGASYDQTASQAFNASLRQREANLAIAKSYEGIAATAKSGSYEQRLAYKMAADAATAASAGVALSAEEIVAATVREIEVNKAAALSFKTLGASAVAGSAEAKVAALGYARSMGAANAALGLSGAAARTHAGSFFALGSGAKSAEQEIGRASRGALAGSGVFRSLGRSLAFASGGFLVFAGSTYVIKGMVQDAASLQKSQEAVAAEFGKSSKAITNFVNKDATALHISRTAAEATATRFGILFDNLKFGKAAGAEMTVNWEKLAGAVSKIRGVDPTPYLNGIYLAAAGNARGLKQMGIFVDTTTQKLALLKAGVIETTKGALTPAQKSLANYLIATGRLPALLAQAAKHTGDFADVQLKLSTQWKNAKEALGTALLPTFSKYAKELSDWFDRMEKSGKMQQDFNAIVKTTVGVVRDVARAIGTGWRIFQTAAGWVGGTKRAIELLLAVLVVSKLAGVGRGFLGIVSAIGKIGMAARVAAIAVTGAEVEISAASAAAAAAMSSALIATGIGAAVVLVAVGTALIIMHWNKVKHWLVEFGRWMAAHAYLLLAIPLIGPAAFAAVEIIKHWQAIKTWVTNFAHYLGLIFIHPIAAIKGMFNQLKNAVVGTFKGIVGTIGGWFAAIPSWLPGVDKFAGWGKSMISWASGSGHDVGVSFGNALQGPIGGALDSVKSMILNAFAGVQGLLKNPGTAVVAGANLMVNTVTSTLARVKDALTRWGVATATIPTTIDTGAAAAMQSSAQRIQNSISAAKKNLDSIGQKLADSLNKYLEKKGGVAGPGSATAAALKKLQDLFAHGGDTTSLERASQQLSSELQAKAASSATSTVASRKAAIKQQFADLTAQYRTTGMSLQSFNKRLAALMAKDAPSWRALGKIMGVAWVAGVRAEVAGLHAQAAALPASMRKGGGGAGAGTEIKIIRPLEVMRQENAKAAARAEKQRAHQIKAADKTAAAAAKTAAAVTAMQHLPIGKLPGTAGKHAKSAAMAGAKP